MIEGVVAVCRKRGSESIDTHTVVDCVVDATGQPVPVVIVDGRFTTTKALETAGYKVALGFESEAKEIAAKLEPEPEVVIDLAACREMAKNLAGYVGEPVVGNVVCKYGSSWDTIPADQYGRLYNELKYFMTTG